MWTTIHIYTIMLPRQLWLDFTGSFDVNVWPSGVIYAIDLRSLFEGTFCCDVNIHGGNIHYLSCGYEAFRLYAKCLFKTPKSLIVVTNLYHNTLPG